MPDGVVLQGVTGMIRRQLFPDMYAGIDEAVLNKAAERGTNIHAQVEFADDFGMDSDTPEVVKYRQLCEAEGLQSYLSEYIVSDEKHFASPIDKVYKLADTEYILGDIKTTSVLNTEFVRWQLSIYATLFERQNPGCKAVKLIAIWLRGDKGKIEEVQRIPDEVVDELLDCEIGGRQFTNPLAPTTSLLPEQYKAMEMQIIDIDTQLKALQEQRETLLQGLKAEMEKAGVKKWETDNLRLTYVAPTTKETFDSKRFKAEHPDVYADYIKTTKTKSSIRLTTL